MSGRSLLVALLISLVLLLNAMAAIPALHELIHHDADRADHQCAVTWFAHGQVDTAVTDVPIVLPSILVETSRPLISEIFHSTVKLLPPGRAPPVLFVVS